MLDESEKSALKKAMGAVASGKMKPGDSMIVKEKSEDKMGGDGDEYDSKTHMKAIAVDMLAAFKSDDADALAELLDEAISCKSASPLVEKE
jgi:hypothetical protein